MVCHLSPAQYISSCNLGITIKIALNIQGVASLTTLRLIRVRRASYYLAGWLGRSRDEILSAVLHPCPRLAMSPVSDLDSLGWGLNSHLINLRTTPQTNYTEGIGVETPGAISSSTTHLHAGRLPPVMDAGRNLPDIRSRGPEDSAWRMVYGKDITFPI